MQSRLRDAVPVVLGLSALLVFSPAAGRRAAASSRSTVEFNRDIRPILADKCFACHGPDKGQRKADLRLDLREVALALREGAAAIVPGKPEESEVYLRITHESDRKRMPPARSGKTLSEREVALVRQWIAEGAEWQEHWSLIPPRPGPLPDVRDAAWPRNPIDHFIAARLEREGLAPSPPADPRTLIRRLAFDITGLPPLPDEVDAFVADPSLPAYDRLADRLLASPRYGERMAMHWLDLVRFADTNGIHGDNHREVTLYRDWVIDAFNENKPFDRFTIEQLAGDVVPEATMETRIASGYNRLLMTTREGGAQPKEYLAKYAADRVRNASTVWMAATMGCAECHDHKFDKYSMRDFYSFAAFFADIQEVAVGAQAPIKVPTAGQAAEIARIDARLAMLREVLETPTPELASAQAEWEREAREGSLRWDVLQPEAASSKEGAELAVLDDGSVLARGTSPDRDTYVLAFRASFRGVTAFRLEALPHESLPAKGPGRAGNGNFVLNEIRFSLDGAVVALAGVSATHSQDGWDARGAADGRNGSGWAILPRAGQELALVVETREDLGDGTERTLVATIEQEHGSRHTIGRLRLAATSAPRPVRAGGPVPPGEIAAALSKAPEERDEGEAAALARYYRGIAPLLEPARRELAQLQARKQEIEGSMRETLVSMSGPPRAMRILPRGNWLDESGELVEPAVPEFMPPLGVEGRRATRLDLARWLVSPDNPVVARVFANRLWKLFFGRGIVATLDDFGSQGKWPSHPALLDWLALEFMRSGWDIRHMVRLIVTSSAYRQSSQGRPEPRERDPYNELVARQGRFRLDAEMVRDNALAACGLLSLGMGGRSVKPYQPEGYWQHLNFPRRTWQEDSGEDLYRRTVYTYWCRTFLHPSLLAFDAPTREECTVDRVRSNTPQQALVLLNDPIYVEAARVLAERLLREATGVEERIHLAFRAVLARRAAAAELELLASLLAKHQGEYAEDVEGARALVRAGAWPAAEDLDPVEHAAWTSIARVLVNLHETITRY